MKVKPACVISFTVLCVTETLKHSVMSSSSRIMSEDHLLCSICLDVFTEPVSTPCGHNYCKKCIEGYWDSSSGWLCPMCNKGLENRPDLSINTFISETVLKFRKSAKLNASSTTGDSPSKPTEDLCDACVGVKEKSVKFCLNCGASYCEVHLEPHKNIHILKKHKLIDPVENLEEYVCQKHERPLELFCRDDQMCVCLFCTVTDHKTHNTVPIEEASDDLKAQLEKTQREVQKMIHDRLEKTKEIRHSLELSKKNTEIDVTHGAEVFTALMFSIERSQAELLKVMEEMQKAAESQAEDLIKDLEQEITDLKRRDTELEQLSHTEDHLHLLQGYPSLRRPPHTKSWTNITLITHSTVEIMKTSLSQLQKCLNHEMDKEKQKLKQRSQQFPAVFHWFMRNWIKVFLLLLFVFLMSIRNAAHPSLIFSNDGKHVRCGSTKQSLLDNVLGKMGFSSGEFYYDVYVKGKTDWTVGVVSASFNRKGGIALTPQNGFWTVTLSNGNEYQAAAGPSVPLTLTVKPQWVQVTVDYARGVVSFYDIITNSLIYSFTGQTFTEKLYPFCCSGDGDENLCRNNQFRHIYK